METVKNLQLELAEVKQREKELQARVDDLNDFIEKASIPLHWVNGSGILIWANQAELEMLGYTAEEYIGNHISNFHVDKDIVEDILVRLTNKQTLKNCHARLRAKDGTIIPVLINSNVRWDGDTFLHTRCFTRDITDLKKLEQEKVSLINELNEKNRRLIIENNALKK